MPWQVRHQGSPRAVGNLTPEQIADGLRDGVWEPTDEVLAPGDTAWIALENHPHFAELTADLETPPAHRVDATHLDMNALIDVCLVLLIFFILTTTYATAVQKVVPMPNVRQSEGKKARVISREDLKRMIRLQVESDKAGKPTLRLENQNLAVFEEDGTLDGAKLKKALQVYTRGEDGKTDVILDARNVNWGLVIALQDMARAAGVRKVHHLLPKKLISGG
jgi:biopolymer transport protein ExbD